ncbi:MAG: PQQ-dependent sugar dehydrogenase, partial [Bacteroidota bacterium]
RYTPGTPKPRKISGVPNVVAKGQGGLLDLALHPDFDTTPWVYISYSAPDGADKATTAVSRYKLKGDALVDGEEIFRASPGVKTRHHYGSRLTFDREGYLFITVGDRGRRDDHPQYLSNHCGKVHRIHDDGRIPADNPFITKAGAQKSIYSYGHRNPQGMALHPETGQIWAHEHGPRGGDELNRIQKGLNYGWPVISYGINYSGTTFTELTAQQGMEQPELYWVPSIAPSGMSFVAGDRYPGWKGDIMAGSLRFKYLNRIDMDGEIVVGEELLLKNIGRVRNVQQGPDGYIYVAIEKPGAILRILPG